MIRHRRDLFQTVRKGRKKMKDFLFVVVGFTFGAALGVQGVIGIANKVVRLFQ